MSLDVLFVGGGTVGHLAPGFAVAAALRQEGFEARFATPGEAGEEAWFAEGEPAPLRAPALRLPRSKLGYPAFAWKLLRAISASKRLLREAAPRVVVGLGGWPCVPVGLAARSAGVPLALFAADRSPGVAVRELRGRATRIYVSTAEAEAFFGDPDRVLRTGPVLRRDAVEGTREPGRFGLLPDRRTLFVMGGSLGAKGLNERIAAGIRDACEAVAGLKDRIQVLHSVGRSGEGIAVAYRDAGIPHRVTRFIRGMGDAYAVADLVVGRAGALSCAELEATGSPAVLVPYPHHADRQQYANARPLVERGGALLLEEADLDSRVVQEMILPLLEDASRLEGMRGSMRSTRSDGAREIATDLIRRFCRREGR